MIFLQGKRELTEIFLIVSRLRVEGSRMIVHVSAKKRRRSAYCRLPGNYQTAESKLGSNLGPNVDKLGSKPCTTT